MLTVSSASIPSKIESFDKFIRTTSGYLNEGETKNYERLSIPKVLVDKWVGFATEWIKWYAKYSDSYSSRTQAVVDEMNTIIEATRIFDDENNFLARIAISENVTITDLEMFNIRNEGKQSRTKPQNPITELVESTIKPIGGGSLMVKCYGKGVRAAILPPANCVQYHYTMGANAPTSAEDENMDMDISTKGSFMLQLGASNEGKRLYIYFRWYNTKHPEIAGPWSAMQTTIIL